MDKTIDQILSLTVVFNPFLPLPPKENAFWYVLLSEARVLLLPFTIVVTRKPFYSAPVWKQPLHFITVCAVVEN